MLELFDYGLNQGFCHLVILSLAGRGSRLFPQERRASRSKIPVSDEIPLWTKIVSLPGQANRRD